MQWWQRFLPDFLSKSRTPAGPVDPAVLAAFEREVQTLNQDPYLSVVDSGLRVLSVFDDLKYDRSDLDMLSAGMRARAMDALKRLGCEQHSGKVMVHRAADVRFIFSGFHALGASPFDIARYTRRRAQDYLVLTPTQSACQIIDHHPFDEALEHVKALIVKQPINVYRLLDYLEHKPAHLAFKETIGYLVRVQGDAIVAAPLSQRRPL